VVLAHDYHPTTSSYSTGGVLGVAPPVKLLSPTFNLWHATQVELRGQHLRVVINGELVQELDVPVHTLRRGHIGFPDMGS
jgi:hypothetical protein